MKTKKISIPTDAKINKKSKDTTYIFKDNCYNRGVTLNFNIVDASETIYAKDGDNLFIMTRFGNNLATNKVVTTIVKDYYTFCDDWKPSTTVDKVSIYETAKATPTKVVSGTIDDSQNEVSYIGDAKNTTYNFQRLYTGDNEIYDIGGNDSYSVKTPYEHVSLDITDYTGKDEYTLKDADYEILDYTGNDIYTASDDAKFKCKDLSGKDEYYLSGVYSGFIRDDNGKDYYEFSNVTSDDGVQVYDWSENDKYKLDTVKKSLVEDAEGNDKYDYKKVTNAKIEDKKGKDKYTFETVSGEIHDYKGSDTYTFTTSAEVKIEDDGGDDKYTFTTSTKVKIEDDDGSDKYSFKEGSDDIDITDVYGKDRYTVDSSNNIYITDGDMTPTGHSGNDEYIISSAKVVEIEDRGGADDYRIAGVEKLVLEDASGNDFYSLYKVENPNFTDYGVVDALGKDEYRITESKKLKITDENGNDKYIIRDSKNISISDSNGNDKYTIENMTVDDLSFIGDSYGKDKYTIKSSKVWIVDSDCDDTYKVTKGDITDGPAVIWDTNTTSNDKYTIDKLTGLTDIFDYGGTKDSLTISSAKSKNLIYMANFQNDGKGVNDGSLIIIDKINGGAVIIENYFETETLAGVTMITPEKDAGCIETIKAGKTKINSKIDAFATTTDLTQLSSDVASWLSDGTHAYESVENLFSKGNEAHIEDFVLTFGQ